MPLRRLAVLGGSDLGAAPEHLAAGESVGRLLAAQGITLLHAGSESGPLGTLLSALSEAEGRARAVSREELLELGDGVLILPGGPASLPELFSLGLSASAGSEKPCGLLNTGDYFSGLLEGVDDATLEQFVRETQRGRLIVARDPAELLRALAEFRPPETRRPPV